MNSDTIKSGKARAPHRSLLFACGMKRADLRRPFIGICNSYTSFVPGHCHLDQVGAFLGKCVREAGGVPMEFNTIAVCDGLAMGHAGMKYSLPSRELIADAVETMVRAHCFDALVCVPNCDKIVPGMLLGALRANVPTIFASGGPMAAGRNPLTGADADLNTVFEGVGAENAGRMSARDLERVEESACPGCGSCSGMFTANSMNCLYEALGLALPGNGTVLATDPRRKALWRKAARRAVEMAKKGGPLPRELVTKTSLDNALTLDMAMGGSTNTVLHTLAIAREAGVDFTLDRMNELSARTPYICKLAPSGHYHIGDLDRAGGVMAILKRLPKGLLHLDAPTVSGKTLGLQVCAAKVSDDDVIRKVGDAYSADGGLAVLRRSVYDEVLRKGDMLRLAGGCVRGDTGREGEAGTRRRHTLRGTEGRTRHAGDARSDVVHNGRGAWRVRRPRHRRKVLRRHSRRMRRTRLSGGSGRRPHRAREKRRRDRDRHSSPVHHREDREGGSRKAREMREAVEAEGSRRMARALRASGRQRIDRSVA